MLQVKTAHIYIAERTEDKPSDVTQYSATRYMLWIF
jgi:hypothetical protein